MTENKSIKHMSNIVYDFFCAKIFQYSN